MSARYRILAIVEGHGDARAVPILFAGLAALRRAAKIPSGEGEWQENIEALRDCKKPLRSLLGRPYEETTDQADFTGALPFTPGMARRSPSYGKLMRALDALTRAARARRTRR